MNFNQILPDNFFNLFQSKHRDLYIEGLIRIYSKYEVGSILGMNKEDARDILIDLIEENNLSLDSFDDDIEDEIPSTRELANYILRRFEQTGWIIIDVNNDYVEILNFTDYAISLILAFIEIKKDSSYSLFADNFSLDSSEQAFKGYIFTIYSLLNSKSYDYGLLLNQVYKNTINFVREIRKVDHKLKEFINLVSTKDNLKELVELLSQYKDDVMDKAYFKLKTFDNVNKYKVDIINKLEHMQESSDIMNIIANDYLFLCDNDVSKAQYTANKQINDCIDIYNSLDSIMDEIDKKNRDYISQTLSKVKYLLNDSNDVAGMLNFILNHYANKVKNQQSESAFNEIKNLFNINSIKALNESSLSFPRGNYKKIENNYLNKEVYDFSTFKDSFLESFKAAYSETDIKELLDSSIKFGEEKDLSFFIKKDAVFNDILRLFYIVIYASSFSSYRINYIDSFYETDRYIIKNFSITKVE